MFYAGRKAVCNFKCEVILLPDSGSSKPVSLEYEDRKQMNKATIKHHNGEISKWANQNRTSIGTINTDLRTRQQYVSKHCPLNL